MSKQLRSTEFTSIMCYYYLRAVPCRRPEILCKHRTYFQMLQNACKHISPRETLERNIVVLYLGIPASNSVLAIQQTASASNLCKHNRCFYVLEKAKVSSSLTGADPGDPAAKWLRMPVWPTPQAHLKPLPPRFLISHEYSVEPSSPVGGDNWLNWMDTTNLIFFLLKKKLNPFLTLCSRQGNTPTSNNSITVCSILLQNTCHFLLQAEKDLDRDTTHHLILFSLVKLCIMVLGRIFPHEMTLWRPSTAPSGQVFSIVCLNFCIEEVL